MLKMSYSLQVLASDSSRSMLREGGMLPALVVVILK